jgi:hypothetical protein
MKEDRRSVQRNGKCRLVHVAKGHALPSLPRFDYLQYKYNYRTQQYVVKR